MDFAIPKSNEKELKARAKELGLELTFLYEPKKVPKGSGVLIRAEKALDLRRADKFSKAIIVVATSNEDVIRAACSKKNITYITNLTTSTGRDHTHYRRGNVNQVIAKLCKQNKIGYLVDFNHILELEGRERELIIGRIKQNIKIFKKYKVPCKVASFAKNEYELRNMKDLEALGRVLGL